MSAAPLIVLAAGGTGGHVFPAEALAEALLARGYRLALVTDNRGAAYGGVLGTIETHRLPLSRMSGGIASARAQRRVDRCQRVPGARPAAPAEARAP